MSKKVKGPQLHSPQTVRLRAIKAMILENLADQSLSIDAVSARHDITTRYVNRLFERDTTTFSQFVLAERLKRARRMLIAPEFSGMTISSIAFEAGFGDISYFNRTFRRHFGETPSAVRQGARQDRAQE